MVTETSMECTGNNHSIWYPWFWNQERRRWERECAMMGCMAWQFASDARPEGRRILKRTGKAHEHAWSVWYPEDELHVENNMFYSRSCPCGALEFVEHIVIVSDVTFFSNAK